MELKDNTSGGNTDRFISKMIRTTEDGRRIFFPPFSKGQGYVIPGEAEYERIRRKLKDIRIISQMSVHVGTIVSVMLAIINSHVHRYSFLTLLFLFGIVIFFVHFILMLMLRQERHGLEPSGEAFPVRKLTFKEQYEVEAAERKMSTWWFFLIFFIGITAMGVFLLFQKGEDREIALTGICGGVFFSIYSIFMLRLKRKLDMKKEMARGEVRR